MNTPLLRDSYRNSRQELGSYDDYINFLITIVINNNLSGLIIAKYLTCLGWSGNQEV